MDGQTLLVGIDDTDYGDSIGTGALARELNLYLIRALGLTSLGITRHQFLVHPDIPYTSHNSSACLAFRGDASVADVVRVATGFIAFLFHPGADPGLCVVRKAQLTDQCTAFGRKAQTDVVRKTEALWLAREHDIRLLELGGEGIGVIGAFGGCALRASGQDGRFIALPGIRDFDGALMVTDILSGAPIDEVVGPDGEALAPEAIVDTRGGVRPNLVDGKVVLNVECRPDGSWRVPKRNKQAEK